MIDLKRHGQVAVITLDRPEKRNALNIELCNRLRDAVSSAVEEGAPAIVITGRGTSFCSGADLGGVYTADFREALYDMLHTVTDAPVPVVAAVNGPAIGAGTQLALAADLRVAAPTAVFGIPTAKIGLAVDPWTIRRFALLAGPGPARAVLMACDQLDAEQAHSRGFVARVGSVEDAIAWAEDLAELAPLTLGYSKQVLNSLFEPELDSVANKELFEAFDGCWASEDFAEGPRRGPRSDHLGSRGDDPMKCAPFDYVRAASVDEVIRALVGANGEGKILAGGQSLVPVLALRMARPSVLVDINRIPGLGTVTRDGSDVQVGTLTRHSVLAEQIHHPLLAEAARWIGHTAIRSRGTAGGSIAHADPSAELPVVAVGTGATVTMAGSGGTRSLPARELFVSALMTSLAEDEMITSVRFPVPSRGGFAEFARRHGDFALVIAVVAEMEDSVRITLGGVQRDQPHRRPARLRSVPSGHGGRDGSPRARTGRRQLTTFQKGFLMDVTFSVNGERVRVEVEPRHTLADVLREQCGLTGTHLGCEHGVCGACTVLVDGQPACACLMFGVQADGSSGVTVEGLAGDDELHPLQEAFVVHHGLQCGFCTPGMLISAMHLLDTDPEPTREKIREQMSGNICRCTGYIGIVDAIAAAADVMRSGDTGVSDCVSARAQEKPSHIEEPKRSPPPGG